MGPVDDSDPKTDSGAVLLAFGAMRRWPWSTVVWAVLTIVLIGGMLEVFVFAIEFLGHRCYEQPPARSLRGVSTGAMIRAGRTSMGICEQRTTDDGAARRSTRNSQSLVEKRPA